MRKGGRGDFKRIFQVKISGNILMKENGSALVISLMVLLTLSLMATAALQVSNMDIRISKNYKDNVQAGYASEAGLEKMIDSFKQGDTNGDAAVNSSDTVNANNDLDGNGTIDFTQILVNGNNLGSSASRITVNSGDMQALIWVDATDAPVSVTIYSKGNPSGTHSYEELAQSIGCSASSIINGAINNAP